MTKYFFKVGHIYVISDPLTLTKIHIDTINLV